jgi:hypothetical protein
MKQAQHKEVFLRRLMRERDRFELLLNRVGFTRRMTLKGVAGTWSIKDILAHVWAYEQYIADRMNEIAHGEKYAPCKTHNALDAFLDEHGYPDFGSPLLTDDEANAWVFERFKNVSLEEIVAQEIQAFASIISSLESLSSESITRHNLFERIADNTFHHYHDHVKDIRSWLKTNAVDSSHS